MNNKFGLGAVPSPKDLRDYKVNKKVAATYVLPREFKVKHSHIKNQGPVGSCVAHSISEVLEAIDETNYSTGWIYGYRPLTYYQGIGMIPSQALKTVRNLGYVDNDSFNINVEMDKAKELVNKDLDRLTKLAGSHKIKSYARLNSINDIKRALFMSSLPVVLSINVGTQGLILDDNFVAQIPNDSQGGHMVVCYGWNETGLLIQNSWGTTWGYKGTFILPYEYPICEAWMITPEEPSKESQIKKPSFYWLRRLIMKFILLIRRHK